MFAFAYPVSEVPPAQAGLVLLVGIACIAIALFNRNFYWQKGAFGIGKPAPRWFGQAMFGGLGLLFIAIGAYNLWIR